MNTPRLPESSKTANKLIVRSEVLVAIKHLVSMGDAPKNERLKQLKRLQEIQPRESVLDILVKELERCRSAETLQVIVQLLMELGTIEYLQDKLWNIIRSSSTTDEVKDASNLVLRHLGDTSDPDLYLEYLEDPQGLIGRETIRMLEVSTENPEALIDFIDFILSLELEDQTRLLSTLQNDYPSEYLVNIYIPLLESDPSPELWELLIHNLGETKSVAAAELLHRLLTWPESRLPVPQKLITKSLKTLQISGAYHPENPAIKDVNRQSSHALVTDTHPYQCFSTVSDGIGNQGILFSRQRPNGDITLVCAAINDVHGIIDCFGFFQISVGDFHKIVEKFHEGTTKIKVSPEYCAYKLQQAEDLNAQNAFRLPYEYRCWQPMLGDIATEPPVEMQRYEEWVRPEWYSETDNLYQHPDFSSWFLEQGDELSVTQLLQKVAIKTEDFVLNPEADEEDYFSALEAEADTLILKLLNTPWKQDLTRRLIEAAYLLHCQNTHTFRTLAATEAHKLASVKEPEVLLQGFTRAYGRRCILEELLRLRTGHAEYDKLSTLVDTLIERWKL